MSNLLGRIVDAHIHFWDPAVRHHEWLGDVPALERRFTPNDVDFGSQIPDGLVFVEADCWPQESLDEVDWVLGLAGSGPAILGIVAHVPLEWGNRAASALNQLRQREKVVGVRRLLQHEPPALLLDPGLIQGTRMLAEHGLTSDLCVTSDQLPIVTELVRACPETSFVLDHLGKPSAGHGVLDPWRSDLRELARCPNVACKLSGLATLVPAGWRHSDVRPYLVCALDAFGPQRCMFGSDWPVSLQNATYQAWLDSVCEATDELTSSEREGVLGEVAIRVYGLENLSEEKTAHARS